MLKFYFLILLCIFLKYPLSILKEFYFEKNISRENEYKIKKDVNSYKLNYRQLEEEENDFYNIGKLKNLLFFQSNLDKTIKKKEMEAKKLRKLQKAAKKGNIINSISSNEKGRENYEDDIKSYIRKEEGKKEKKDEYISRENEEKENKIYNENNNSSIKQDNSNIQETSLGRGPIQYDKNEKTNLNPIKNDTIYQKKLDEGNYNGQIDKVVKRHEHSNWSDLTKTENDDSSNNMNLSNILKNLNFYKNIELVKSYFGNYNKKENEEGEKDKKENEDNEQNKKENEEDEKNKKENEENDKTSIESKNNQSINEVYKKKTENEGLKNESVKNEGLKNESVKNESVKNESVKNESVKNENNQIETINEESKTKIDNEVVKQGKEQINNISEKNNNDIIKDNDENDEIKLLISKRNKENPKNNIHEYVYNIIEKNASNKNFNLRRKDIKEFLDVHELVKNIKFVLGIKSNIHEKFEHEKLILKDCNYESFGPDFCSVNDEAKETLWEFENKKNCVFLFIILFTLIFSLVIQNIVYFIEKSVRNSKDQFRKDLLNTAFRQISLITIINLTIWGILQSNIAEALDEIIFNDILPKERNVDKVLHNVEPLLEIIFEKILFISMNFLVCYSIFIINIHFVTRRILKWFSEADNCDVSSVVKEIKNSKRRCLPNFFFLKNVRNSKYLAHRYDFSENVDAISIPGLDPNGYYYYEYMRACLLKYNVKLIKIPNTVILFLIFICISLRPFFNIRLKAEVIFLNTLSLICITGLILLFFYLYNIDKKLLPKDISKYLLNRYHIESSEQSKKDIIPYYKLSKQKSIYPSTLNYFFFKTTFPNKHEQLFYFWGNGPPLINFIFQTLCFCFLIILSCWIFLLRVDNITWFQLYSYGSIAICVCILVFFFILKYIIYYNIMISKTGYLIDTKLLEKVWEFERSDNIKRISEFIDAIKIKSTLHALKEGGEVFWRQLLIKSNTVPSNIQEKMFSIWVGLDEENRGIIDSAKILKFLKSQGINLTSENDIKEFLEVFDRNNKNGLNQEEFFVLIIIVKQILVELLDINAVQSLFEEVYGIPWKSLSAIDVNSLKKILSELNLKWPHGKVRNLIDFVCENKKTKYVSAEYFIKQLINIEEVTLQPFHSPSDMK
ncbi:conserved Plasmodium protein, unknown function [Plasmodium gallinaceum]|uniref:EF-hand domain-containing protein n=1 Tax=Plasmodium gallinaceum TaxID=5849 RepID=A0A1J1GRD6_PLAGA|nr:conserved Plasmodium protein, unknown function [Plasmodium gallinaceum]CRG94836.1 conserved Plasmodium protein, unknown function [Plasmodium gallinaceum]